MKEEYTMQDLYNILQECLQESEVDSFAILVGTEDGQPIFAVRMGYGSYYQEADVIYDERDFRNSIKSFIQELSQAFFSQMDSCTSSDVNPVQGGIQSQNEVIDNDSKEEYCFYNYNSKTVH